MFRCALDLWLVLSALLSSGCAYCGTYLCRSDVDAAVQQRAGYVLGPETCGRELMIPPGVSWEDRLTEDEAVAIALWNNAAFLEALTELGLVRADVITATQLPNPELWFLAPAGAIAFLVIAFGLTFLAVSRLGQEFLPNFQETDFLMHFVEKPGTSIEAMDRVTVQASRELRAIPDVRNFGSHIGRAEAADEVVGPNFTELWISIDSSVDYASTVDKIQQAVDGYPGLYRDVLTYKVCLVRLVPISATVFNAPPLGRSVKISAYAQSPSSQFCCDIFGPHR